MSNVERAVAALGRIYPGSKVENVEGVADYNGEVVGQVVPMEEKPCWKFTVVLPDGKCLTSGVWYSAEFFARNRNDDALETDLRNDFSDVQPVGRDIAEVVQ